VYKSQFKNNQLIILTILLSVSFHLVIVYFAHQSTSQKKVAKTKIQQNKPLQATLIFDLPAKPVIEPVIKPVPPFMPKPVSQPSEIQKQIPQTETPIEIAKIEPKRETVTPKKPSNQTKELTKDQPQIKPQALINSQFTGTAGKHVQQYNLQQDAQMVAEASQYYQQQKNSPIIHAPNKSRFVTEEEKMLNKTKIRANCDGTSRKIAATLLGFMGGNVSCTRPPSINGFINKRINRENSLPAKYKIPLDELPKSVVIQE
jgi:outer membrane biosynthesis protein TonB